MRKLAVALGIIILVLVLVVVVFASTFDVNRYRGQIQAELEKRLDRKVALGDMHLGLFPLRFRVQDLSIADDPKFGGTKPFIRAQELDVSVKLLPLLHKSVEVDSLTLQRPAIELIKNAQGAWNFSTLGANQAAATAGNQPPSASGQQFTLGKLTISDGQAAITDGQAHKPRTVYDHINLTLADFAPDTPFTLEASVHFPGQGAQEIHLQGKGGPLVQVNPAATPFHGALDLKAVGIADLQKFLQMPALANADGVLSGHTNIADDSGKLAADGQISFERPRIHGMDLGYPITAEYNLNDDLLIDVLRINKAAIKLGATPLYITGTVNTKPTPALLDINLRADNVSVAELARLAAASGTALAPGIDLNGRLNASITARGPADKPALSGTLNGRNIQASGKALPQPVQIPAVNLALSPSTIQSDNFQVISGGTTANTQFSLKNYTSTSPYVDATMKAPQAQLPAIIAIAKAYGVSGADKLTGAGTLNLDMHAAGPLQSITSDQIMRALNGNMNLNFANLRYSGADIGHQLASIGKFLKTAPSLQNDRGFTNILKMTGNVVVRNGLAQTNNLQALLDIANVGITGSANLPTQALNLDVTAVLSKAFSQQVGGAGIGGFLNTALANNQGEIVIPASVTGTFQKPIFTPNVQKLAQMRLKGLLPNSSNPLAGASGLLGGLLGNRSGQNQQPQANAPQTPQGAVQDLLGGLFGKKKKKTPPQ